MVEGHLWLAQDGYTFYYPGREHVSSACFLQRHRHTFYCPKQWHPRVSAFHSLPLQRVVPLGGPPSYILLYLQLHLCHHIQLSLIDFCVNFYFRLKFLDCYLHFYQSLASPRLVMGSHPICPPFCKGRWRRGALILAVRVQGRPDRCLLRAGC